jgi:hypothetical protein
MEDGQDMVTKQAAGIESGRRMAGDRDHGKIHVDRVAATR